MKLRTKLFLVSFFCSFRFRKKIKRSKIKKVLLLRFDRIGDMVITTPLIRSLYLHGYEISTISQKDSIDFISNNPYVINKYIWDRSITAIIKNLFLVRKYKYDLAIDMREQLEVKSFLFSLLTGARYLVGFNKANIRKFDKSIYYNNPSNHISMKMDAILKEVFDIFDADLHYDAFVSVESENIALNFINKVNKANGKIFLINPFASLRDRDMSYSQISYIVDNIKEKYHDACVVIIGSPVNLASIGNLNAHIFHSKSINDVIPLIKYCDILITVDTAALHIAGAFDRKIVGLYGLFFWDENAQWLKWDFFNSNAMPELFDIKNYLHKNECAFGIKTNNSHVALYSEKGALINTISKEKIVEAVFEIVE